MPRQFGAMVASPVPKGKRMKARIIHLVLIAIPAVLILTSRFVSIDAVRFIMEIVGWLLGISLALMFAMVMLSSSTTLGGRLVGFRFVDTRTNRASGFLLLIRTLVQGIFEVCTLGLGMLVAWFSYRDGQHWFDRIFNLVAVPNTVPAPVTAPMRERFVPDHAGMRAAELPMPGPMRNLSAPAGPSASQPVSSVPRSAASAPQPVSSIPRSAASAPQPVSPIPQSAPSAPQPVSPVPRSAASAPQPVSPIPQSAPSAPQPVSPIPQSAPPAPQSAPPSSHTPFPEQDQPQVFPAPAAMGPTPMPWPAPQSSPAELESDLTTARAQRAILLADWSGEENTAPEATPGRRASHCLPEVILDDGRIIEVDCPIVLGRNPLMPENFPTARCVAVLDSTKRMSKTHLLLIPEPDGVLVMDTGATNGVFVDSRGQRIKLVPNEPWLLNPDDVVHFGGRSLELSL